MAAGAQLPEPAPQAKREGMDTQTRRLCQVTGFLGLRPPGSQGSLQFPTPPPQLLCLRFQGTCPCCQPQYLLALTADVLRERHLHIRGWVSSTDLQELGARGKGKRECLGLLSALPTALARLRFPSAFALQTLLLLGVGAGSFPHLHINPKEASVPVPQGHQSGSAGRGPMLQPLFRCWLFPPYGKFRTSVSLSLLICEMGTVAALRTE